VVNNRIGNNFYGDNDDDEESSEYKDRPSCCFRGPTFAIDLSSVKFVVLLSNETSVIARIGFYENPTPFDIDLEKNVKNIELVGQLIDAFVDFTDNENLEEA